jgi:hypothetical protein
LKAGIGSKVVIGWDTGIVWDAGIDFDAEIWEKFPSLRIATKTMHCVIMANNVNGTVFMVLPILLALK